MSRRGLMNSCGNRMTHLDIQTADFLVSGERHVGERIRERLYENLRLIDFVGNLRGICDDNVLAQDVSRATHHNVPEHQVLVVLLQKSRNASEGQPRSAHPAQLQSSSLLLLLLYSKTKFDFLQIQEHDLVVTWKV